jgi:hypothetical protein
MWRSTVLSLPLKLVFPGYSNEWDTKGRRKKKDFSDSLFGYLPYFQLTWAQCYKTFFVRNL